MKNNGLGKRFFSLICTLLMVLSVVFCFGVSTYAAEKGTPRATAKAAVPQIPVIKGLINKNEGINISWNKVPSAVKYRVYRRGSGESWKFLKQVTSTSFCDTQVKNSSGNYYRYTVRAVDKNGKYSKYQGINGGPVLQRMSSPHMTAVSNNINGIYVKWNSVKGAKEYRIYRRGAGEGWKYITKTTSTSYVDSAIKDQSGAIYRYTVRAVGGAISYFESGLYTRVVPTPKMISVSNGNGGMAVKWNAVKGVSSYRIYKRGAGESWKYLATTSGTSYVDKSVANKNGAIYRYTVRAVNGYYSAFESGLYSRVIAPPHMTSAKNTKDGILVNWNPVPNAQGYNVFRRGAGESWKYLGNVKDTHYLDKEVMENDGAPYRYTCRAIIGRDSSWFESGVFIKVVAEISNLQRAQKLYGTENVIVNNSFAELQNDLFTAALERATDNNPCIVYVPGGREYTVTSDDVHNKDTIVSGYKSGIYVPKNVILVAENDTIFNLNAPAEIQRLVLVSGSVYGGNYKGNNKCQFVLQFRKEDAFDLAEKDKKQTNGNIENTIVSGATACGIKSISNQNVIINSNKVSDCRTYAACGIGVAYGTKAFSISGNEITNVGAEGFGSGIDVTHANVTYISNNKITNAAGHGISTDTDQKPISKTRQTYVKIDYVSGNTVSNSGKHGIWLENRCQITKELKNNNISASKNCGIAIEGKNAYEGGDAYSIKSMSGNTISGSTLSNLSIAGAFAKVQMDSNNVIKTSGKMGIVLDYLKDAGETGGKLYIVGSNNKIAENNDYGIYLKNGSQLSVTATGTNYIQNNVKYAIGLYNKSSATVKNMDLTKNTKGTAYIGTGSSFKHSACKTEKIVNGTTI